MSRTKEKIKYFTENLNLKTAINRSEQIKQLAEELGKLISKAYKLENKINFDFNNYDLIKLVIALEKIHKKLNKQASFTDFQKRIENLAKKTQGKTKRETQELHWELFKEQLKIEQKIMVATFNIQWALAKINMLCTVLLVYETTINREKEQEAKEDGEILTHCIYEALISASEL